MEPSEQMYKQYAYFFGPKKKGESRILRNAALPEHAEYPTEPFPGIDTVLKAFDRTVARIPDSRFLATREILEQKESRNADGALVLQKKLGAYQWKTFHEAKLVSEWLARSILFRTMHSLPGDLENAPQTDGFFGIFTRNREEWLLTDLACMRARLTSACLYDALGAEAFEHIITKQTGLKSLVCSRESLDRLFYLKSKFNVPSL